MPGIIAPHYYVWGLRSSTKENFFSVSSGPSQTSPTRSNRCSVPSLGHRSPTLVEKSFVNLVRVERGVLARTLASCRISPTPCYRIVK